MLSDEAIGAVVDWVVGAADKLVEDRFPPEGRESFREFNRRRAVEQLGRHNREHDGMFWTTFPVTHDTNLAVVVPEPGRVVGYVGDLTTPEAIYPPELP